MIQIFLKVFNRIHDFFLWLWRQEGTPAKRARGIAVGVFSGCFPFFGFQTLFGIILASIFRGNHLLAMAGTWISNPLTYIPLYWFNYQVGASVLGNKADLNNLSPQGLWDHGWTLSGQLLLGSTLVGFLSAVITGSIVYLFLKRKPSNKFML